MPLWFIIGAVCALPWIVARSARHAASDLADSLTGLTTENRTLQDKLKQLGAHIQAESDRDKRLIDAEERLRSYESLEAEIMGLLNDGGEHHVQEILRRTSLWNQRDGEKRVLRAINSLRETVEGTGGMFPKYRRRRDT